MDVIKGNFNKGGNFNIYNMDKISINQKDFLKELANIGIGHAATSLSQMVDAPVEISLPEMHIISIENILGLQSHGLSAVTMGMDGELRGMIAVVFSDDSSYWVIDKISGNPENTTHDYEGMGKDALKEFANIIGGAFLTSLSNFTQFDFLPKPPVILTGKGIAIREDFKKLLDNEVSEVLSVKTELFIDNKKIDGDIFLVLDESTFKKIFERMNV